MAESHSLKRLSYFAGQLLTAESFKLEQEYFREKQKLHNRSLHGFGIISGLKVSAQSGQIVVEPGLALDCEGNELVVVATVIVSPPTGDAHSSYVQVSFAETFTDPVPAVAEPQSADSCTNNESDLNHSATITEGCEILLAPENSNRGHRHLRGRWLACAQPHALTSAKLKQSGQGWHVERGYRPPRIK
jgi:hypothetical protein